MISWVMLILEQKPPFKQGKFSHNRLSHSIESKMGNWLVRDIIILIIKKIIAPLSFSDFPCLAAITKIKKLKQLYYCIFLFQLSRSQTIFGVPILKFLIQRNYIPSIICFTPTIGWGPFSWLVLGIDVYLIQMLESPESRFMLEEISSYLPYYLNCLQE